MVRQGNIIAFAMMLLVSGVFASFVQDPIPPSSQKNYFMDYDKNGRMDHLVIRFLGDISKDYISQRIDSLTVDWVDSAGEIVHMQIPGRDFILDTTSRRSVIIDLAKWQDEFYPLTGLSTPDFFASPYGTCKLYLSTGNVYNISVKDGMAPAVSRYRLRKRLSGGDDTLEVSFTVYSDFMNYKAGIFEHVQGEVLALHTVMIIGFGAENGVEYWSARDLQKVLEYTDWRKFCNVI